VAGGDQGAVVLQSLEHLLRGHTFSHAFEGFDYYSVTIEEDRSQADGSISRLTT